MPTLQDVQRNQAVQNAQASTYNVDFDPDVILQEIANKDMQLQMKEQELAQREQGLAQQQPEASPEDSKLMQAIQLLNELVEARQGGEPEQPAPVVPMNSAPSPMPQGGAMPQQGGADISEQTMANLQPGQEATVTKKIVMTPDGPMEVGRSEKIKGMAQQQPQAMPPQG